MRRQPLRDQRNGIHPIRGFSQAWTQTSHTIKPCAQPNCQQWSDITWWHRVATALSISKNKQYFPYSLDRVWIIKQLHTQKSILTSQYYTLVFEPPDSEGFILPEEVISPPLEKDTPLSHPFSTDLSNFAWGNWSFSVFFFRVCSNLPWRRCQARQYWYPPGPMNICF